MRYGAGSVNKRVGAKGNTRSGKPPGLPGGCDSSRLLIDAIEKWWSESFCIAALDGQILYVNDATCRATGYPRHELLSASICDIDPNYAGEAWEKHVQDVRKAGTVRIESSHVTADGKVSPVLIQTILMKYEDREYLFSFARDITDEKAAESKLDVVVRQYRWLADNMTEGVIVMDMDLNMIYMSPSAQKMSGYTFEEFRQLNDDQKFTPESVKTVRTITAAGFKRIENLRKGEELHASIDLECIRKNGTTLWCAITLSLINEEDKPFGILLVIRDISRRKRMGRIMQENEQRYRSLFQYNPLATYSLDLQGRFTSVNMAACRLTGYTEDEALRMNFKDVVAMDCLDGVSQNFQKSITGEAQHYELVIVNKEGKRIDIRVTSCPVVVENNIVGVYGIAEDVSAQKEMLEALRISEEKYRSVAENAGEAIIVAQDGHIKFANAKLAELQGITREEMLARPMVESVHPDDRDYVWKRHLARMKGDEDPFPYGFRVINPDGVIRYVEVNSVIISWEGKPATLNFLSDVTRHKEAEGKISKLNNELVDRINELEMANKEIEAFAYAVSHDLTAPLRSINGFCQALQEECSGKLDTSCEDYLQRMRAASQRMSQQIEDMLMLSRIIRVEMNWVDVDLSAIAHKFARVLQQSNVSRQVEFVIRDGMMVRGDERLLETVMENLLRNAWKFTGRHDKARVEFGSKLINNEQTYYLKDDGAGFNMRYAERLFIPFQRMHTAEEFSGNGVGLATVKRIVSRHGGKVWAESEVEKGTTVYFTIPQRTGD